MKLFELDLDKLHRVALRIDKGRKVGNTTLFIYDMIGVALTNAFDYSKDKKGIYVVFSKPHTVIMETLKRVEEICEIEKVYFRSVSAGTIVIANTVFQFIRNYDEDLGKGVCESNIWWNTDCCWNETATEGEIFCTTVDSVNLCRLNLTLRQL